MSKVTYLSVSGTVTHTLRQRPAYVDITATPVDENGWSTFTIKRKPLRQRVRIWLAWHLWKRWRKVRIRIGPSVKH